MIAGELIKLAKNLTSYAYDSEAEEAAMDEFQDRVSGIREIEDIAWGELDYGKIPVFLTLSMGVMPDKEARGWTVSYEKDFIVPPREVLKKVQGALRGSNLEVVRNSGELPKSRVISQDRDTGWQKRRWQSDTVRFDLKVN
jgi:hypothetical protein